MTRSKLFLATLLMSVSVLASAAVKIVLEPLEIKELSRKVSLPSEITVSALERHIDIMVHEPYGGFSTQDEIREVAWSAPASLSGYQDFLSRLTGSLIPLYTSAGWPFAKYYEEDLK